LRIASIGPGGTGTFIMVANSPLPGRGRSGSARLWRAAARADSSSSSSSLLHQRPLFDTGICQSSVADPDPHVFRPPGSGRGMDPAPDPDPSIIMRNSKKNLDSYYFVTLLDFLSLKNDVNVPSKSNKHKNNC
jgi:hypothetical protein